MLSSLVTVLALVAGSNANSLFDRATCSCSFHLTTSGNVKFPVGEDAEGEVLGGSKLTQASFCLNGNTIVDSKGNPCLFTPPSTVLQCDQGANPSTGFSIGCNGVLSYNGQTTFYECANGQGDEVNIYSSPNSGGSNCGAITLTADSCHAACPTTPVCPAPSTVTVTSLVTVCPSSAKPPPPPPTSTYVAPPPPKSTCPVDLTGKNFEFPHLIVPIDSSNPKTAGGTSYFGQVSSTISSLFNFDVPSSDAGKTCDLWFLFPAQAQLQTSSYTLSGSGAVDFAKLSGIPTQSTSYSTAPGVASDLGQFTLAPGNAYKLSTFACPAGQTVSYEMKAVGNTALKYFQDYNPCAIGLYIVPE